MSQSLADRIRDAHRQQFVGREEELALFESALDADEPPFAVLYVHGPGGVGKSSLLQAMQYRCTDRDVNRIAVDARHVEPTPANAREALKRSGLDFDAPPASRTVLFLDTLEAWTSLMPWVRETLLPQLPASLVTVMAGRTPPPPSWRSDLGLAPLLKVCPLRNLPTSEGRAYLDQRGVPGERHDDILQFAHGHPLALSLAADAVLQSPEASFAPTDAPDLVGELVQRFLENVPSAAHRRSLEACALVRGLTEPLIGALLEDDHLRDTSAHALFQWLRGLSFVESSPDGLVPHDIVRTSVVADLKWRDPEAFKQLQQRAREHTLHALESATSGGASSSSDAQRILTDYLFLFRHNPIIQPFFQRLRDAWNAGAPPVRDAATDDDAEALRAMVETHEGEAAAQLFSYWWERQPEDVQVFRRGEEGPVGFVFPLDLGATTEEDRAEDPAVDAAWTHLAEEAPLRGGETATLFRFWMAQDAYQSISPVQSLISAYRVRYYLTTPGLAYTFVPAAEPERWELLFAYGDLHRLDDADYTVGETTYALFGHDWRTVPPRAWLDLLAERDLSPMMLDDDAANRPTVLVLSRSDFDDAVKDAFKAYARPEAMHGNPLLRSRLVADATGLDADVEARIDVLCTRLREAAETLQQTPKTSKYYRAVHATYLDPQPTQERAAEHLDLPFSTYRRYLRKGIAHVADLLWRDEVGTERV